MCGIVTVVGKRLPQDMRLKALRSLAHRGPDDEGEWASDDPPVWLGHRRLTIVDLSTAGRQPMSSRDGELQLVCNGEIYNYKELKAELERKGYVFASASDSEVILHAYDAWGAAAMRPA